MSNKPATTTGAPPIMVADLILRDEPEKLISFAEQFGSELSNSKLSTSQIRLAFGQIRQIEAMWRIPSQQAQAERLLLLLKPRMAYQTARENNAGNALLQEILSKGIDAVYENTSAASTERAVRFHRFVDLCEALLAYHKVTEVKNRSRLGHARHD